MVAVVDETHLTLSPLCPARLAAAQVDLALRVSFTLEAAVQVGATAWLHTALAALFDFDVRQVLLRPLAWVVQSRASARARGARKRWAIEPSSSASMLAWLAKVRGGASLFAGALE
jgi:hypothetical protein